MYGLEVIRSRRLQLDWYDLILIGLAGVIVFPDYVLDWLSDVTGKTFHFGHLIALEAIAVLGLVVTMLLLMPQHPRLDWSDPLIMVVMLGGFRTIHGFLMRMFD